MIIKIKDLIAFQIYYLMIYNAFVGILGVPSLIKHVLDINLVLILVLSLSRVSTMFKNKNYNKFFAYIIFYMILMLMIAAVKTVPLGQTVWAVRNNFFFIFFFMICIDVMHKEDCERIMNNLLKLQIFNVACAAVEFIFMGKTGDFLGGMFGVEHGCNGYLLIYMTVITVYTLTRYLKRLESAAALAWITLSNIILAAVSEIKIYFVELVLIFFLAFLLGNKKSLKNIYIVLFATIALIIGFSVMAQVFEGSMSFFNDIDDFLYYNTRSEYAEGWRINRFTAIDQINTVFFNGDILLEIFGFGLGACESSQTFDWCNSSFADKYTTTQYRNLTVSMNYLETGYLGLIMFAAIFIAIILITNKFKKTEGYNSYINNFAQIFAIIIIIHFAYNAGIRIEIAYLSYFALALPFIFKKDFDRDRQLSKADIQKPSVMKSKYIKRV